VQAALLMKDEARASESAKLKQVEEAQQACAKTLGELEQRVRSLFRASQIFC